MNRYQQHEKAVAQLAKELENSGYSVVLSPSDELIPFSLEGYQPDLLATKRDEHLVVEVRLSDSKMSSRELRKVSEIIAKHPGWKFSIRTLPDAELQQEEASQQLTSTGSLQTYLRMIEQILATDAKAMAIPYIWNVVIAILRRKAAKDGIPYSDLTDHSLINNLYSLGQLSSDDYEELRRWMNVRNRAVNAVDFDVNAQTVSQFWLYAKKLLESIAEES